MMKFSTALKKGVLGLTIAFGAASAYAIPAFTLNGSGPTEIKFTGVTAPSADGGATKFGSGLESTFGGGYVTSINEAGNPANVFWQQGVTNTISFMIYGIADDSAAANGPNFNLFNSGCTVGPNCDGKIHIDFYLDNTTAHGGTNPGFTGAGAVKASNRSGKTLGGLTDGTFLMGWEFVPGIVTGDSVTTLFQNVSALTLPAKGDGDFLADCVSGPGCAFFNTNGETNGADFAGQFTLLASTATSPTGLNGWGGRISDPVNANIPEPATLLLLAIGLLGLAGAARRRKF